MECEEKVEKLLNIIERVANREYERDNWRGILDSVAELFEADGAAIGEIREGYLYYTKVSSSFKESLPDYNPEEFKVPVWRSGYKEVLEKRPYIIINDYQNYKCAVEQWKRKGLKVLVVAMLGDKEPLGSLSVGRLRSNKPFTEEDGKILRNLAFIFSFMVKEELEKRKLVERAIKDHLTQLYNRSYLEIEGKKEIERAKRYNFPVSLIMFDLDDFKKVNDSYGHRKGDEVIVKFAQILKSKVRSTTDMPVRYGGKEFIVLLPYTYLEEAVQVAERIRKEFENTVFRFDSDIVRLTVSAGVASCDPEDCDLEALFYKADKAMYVAKKEGKNRVAVFSHRLIN